MNFVIVVILITNFNTFDSGFNGNILPTRYSTKDECLKEAKKVKDKVTQLLSNQNHLVVVKCERVNDLEV